MPSQPFLEEHWMTNQIAWFIINEHILVVVTILFITTTNINISNNNRVHYYDQEAVSQFV